MGEAWKYNMVPKWETKIEEEEKRPQSEKTEDAKKWDSLVPERKLSHIKKHTYQAEWARGLRDHKYWLFPQRIPSEILSPKILTLEKDGKHETIQKTHKTETSKHKVTWTKEQMKGHQDRMIWGRTHRAKICSEVLQPHSIFPKISSGKREGESLNASQLIQFCNLTRNHLEKWWFWWRNQKKRVKFRNHSEGSSWVCHHFWEVN